MAGGHSKMSRRPAPLTLGPLHFAVIAVGLGLLVLLSGVVLFTRVEPQVPPTAPPSPRPYQAPVVFLRSQNVAIPQGTPLRLAHVTSATLRENVGRLITVDGVLKLGKEYLLDVDGEYVWLEAMAEHPGGWVDSYFPCGMDCRVRAIGTLRFAPEPPMVRDPGGVIAQRLPARYYFAMEETVLEALLPDGPPPQGRER